MNLLRAGELTTFTPDQLRTLSSGIPCSIKLNGSVISSVVGITSALRKQLSLSGNMINSDEDELYAPEVGVSLKNIELFKNLMGELPEIDEYLKVENL